MNVPTDLARLAEAMKFRARFQEQTHHADSNRADYAFELSWHRPARATPPVDLLQVLDRHFTVKHFELTTEL